MVKAGQKIDRLFHYKSKAQECIDAFQSNLGRQAISEFDEKREIYKQVAKDYIDNPPLSFYVKKYIRMYVIKPSDDPVKLRSQVTTVSRLNNILEVVLEHDPIKLTGLKLALKRVVSTQQKKKLGDFKLPDISEITATDYIRERLKTCKKSTVLREVGTMQSFFNKLRYIDGPAFKALDCNPFQNADKTLLRGHNKKRRRRLGEDEQNALIAALDAFSNPDMKLIFELALSTGLRRGEILNLRWSQIDQGVVNIEESKSGDRTAVLTNTALEVLRRIPRKKKSDRIFNYTLEGFSSNWQRIVSRAGLTDFRFHDLRREFISRVIEKIASPIVISELTGLSDIRHIETSYIEKSPTLETEAGLRKAVGHSTKQVNASYSTIRRKNEKA